MTRLIFKYGTMNSGKTAIMLMCVHTLRSQGKKVTTVKPSVDTREGSTYISSRVGLKENATIILDAKGNLTSQIPDNTDIIIVDEAQFLSIKNVEELRWLATYTQVPVICYGLLTDYRTKLFPGSKRLLELSDQINEISYNVCESLGNCRQCKSNKAIVNAKFTMTGDNCVIIKKGSSAPDVGAEEKYKPLCWSCWSEPDKVPIYRDSGELLTQIQEENHQ